MFSSSYGGDLKRKEGEPYGRRMLLDGTVDSSFEPNKWGRTSVPKSKYADPYHMVRRGDDHDYLADYPLYPQRVVKVPLNSREIHNIRSHLPAQTYRNSSGGGGIKRLSDYVGGGGIKRLSGYVGGGPGNDDSDDSDDDKPLIARPAPSRRTPAGDFDIHRGLAHLNLADTRMEFGPTDESVFAFQEPTPEEIQDRRRRMATFQRLNMGAMPPNPQNFVTMQGGQRVPIGYELNPDLLNWQQTYAARGPQL